MKDPSEDTDILAQVTEARDRILNEGISVLVTDLVHTTLAVKEGDTFLFSDREGNLGTDTVHGLGLFHRDTRFLSLYRLTISGREPVLLSSSAERAYLASVDLTNPDIYDGQRLMVPQQTLNVRRTRAVRGRLYDRIRIKNYNPFPIQVRLELSFGADFADVFELRGLERTDRGTIEPARVHGRRIEFRYRGQDEVTRTTRIELSPAPEDLEVAGTVALAGFRLDLPARESTGIEVEVEPVVGDDRPDRRPFDTAVRDLRRSYDEWERECTQINTDNDVFDQLLARGLRDLRALYTRTPEGGVFSAGIPWYVATFGRDALITSHQLLMVNPRPARETLRMLAAHQGARRDDWRDEEPGKILHETRRGELAGAGDIPHSAYFGSIDATPWFLIVLAQYFRWTNDIAFVQELLPAAEGALRWIDEFGDRDGDGFVEYETRSPKGLANQGWKDAWDAVVHTDGTVAPTPIALVEVQGYVYLAKVRIADVFQAIGDHERAAQLRKEAEELRSRFATAFWMEDEGFLAEALDGDKKQVRTVTSNAGHALYCDIVSEDHARAVARRLFQPDMYSGWGIRTMSQSARAYNPMSYHNGSVWPHDNALIAAGLKRYGYVNATNRVATAIFDAATHADYMRLPELFCGFPRRAPTAPVYYPVACSPQAWAAGAPFLLLQALLGVSARAHENLLTVNKPHLPPWLERVELKNLRVGDGTVSLEFRREAETTGFSLIGKDRDVRVVMEE